MAIITQLTHINDNTFLLAVKGVELGKSGQFYTLRASKTTAPFLPRPISIFDIDYKTQELKMIIAIVGEGTQIISDMRAGDSIEISGPFGNGFTLPQGNATLIGGGIGSAPIYLLAKEIKHNNPQAKITVNLGFAKQDETSAYFYKEFLAIADKVTLNIGGYVTDDVDFGTNNIYYACGTEPMMKACSRLARQSNATMYVSLDKRMACGVGACLVCTCQTTKGNRRACKDGPVFPYQEVYYE